MLFHSDRSTFPYRLGFPIMVANLVRIAMHEAGLLEVAGKRTGTLPPVRLAGAAAVQVVGPDGASRSYDPNQEGLLTGVWAPKVGRYEVRGRGGESVSVGVSLLRPEESLLESVDTIELAELAVAVSQTPIKADRPLWALFAWMALAMLALEWWFYQRRPGGVW